MLKSLLTEANMASYLEDASDEILELRKMFLHNSDFTLDFSKNTNFTDMLYMYSKKQPAFKDNAQYAYEVDYLNKVFNAVRTRKGTDKRNLLCTVSEYFNENEGTGEVTHDNFSVNYNVIKNAISGSHVIMCVLKKFYFDLKNAKDVIPAVYEYVFNNPIIYAFEDLSNKNLENPYIQTLIAQARRAANELDLLLQVSAI